MKTQNNTNDSKDLQEKGHNRKLRLKSAVDLVNSDHKLIAKSKHPYKKKGIEIKTIDQLHEFQEQVPQGTEV